MNKLTDKATDKKVLNKNTKVEATKKELNLDSILDNLNLDSIKDKIQIKSKIESKKSSTKNALYLIDKDDSIDTKQSKSLRSKFRRVRINFENDILKFYSENKTNELKVSLKEFLKFYKETYILQDFSLYSIISNNTDTEKMKKTDEFLKVIKQLLQIK